MVREEDAVHVPDLALVPVGRLEDLANWIDRRQLVGVGFDSDARVVAQRQQIVDDFETLLAAGNVHAGDVDQTGELGVVVVFQELQHREDSFGADQHFQLIARRELHPLNVSRQAVGDVFAEVGQDAPRRFVWLSNRG